MQEPFEKLEHFFSQHKRLVYKKRELIIRADDIPSGIYFIKKGYARRYALSELGQEFTQIIFKPQDIFPIVWAMTDSPNIQYFESMTDIELFRAPKKDFIEFVRNNQEITFDVLQRILVRLEGIFERMEYMVFGNAYQKIASILVICAERFGASNNSEIVIKVPLTHRDIASLVGLTRETTSVELKKLEDAKIIYKKGNLVRVKNIKKLKTEANWYEFV